MNPRILPSLFAGAALSAVTAAQAPAEIYSTERARELTEERRAAADLLLAALDRGAELDELAAAAARAADRLRGAPATAARLEEAVRDARGEGGLADLERAVERVAGDLRFRLYVEAELPLGWPATAPVGEVVLKSYPRYRMARTEMAARGGMGTPFFALFNHIQRNDIAMTAPVQMDYSGESGQRATSMAFLYSHPEQGDAGEDGADERVEVVDVAPILAISIGARGYETPQQSADLRARLQAWLMAHAEEFEAAGPPRTMGYNSPMVPASRRFFEVEIPVRRIQRDVD